VEGRRSNQTITGVVVSDKMDKTVVVLVNRQVRHPVYKKYIRRRAKFMAHDERNVAKMGDTVEIIASRPLSKLKRWRLIKILAHQA
jgi:small subunit ribosomal protein S17